MNSDGRLQLNTPRPCQCEHCRKRRGEGPSEARSLVSRIFSLTAIQQAVYDAEAREIGDAIDNWIEASIQEDQG